MFSFIWCKTHQYDDEIKKLFLSSLTADYISHSEIQCGRAINTKSWQNNLDSQFQSDLDAAIDDSEPALSVAIALQNDVLLGAAFISYTKAAIHYATLDDLMISEKARGMGLGTEFLHWIEIEIKNKGIKHLFLESGIRNKNAHHFFEKHGFTPVSVTMLKEL